MFQGSPTVHPGPTVHLLTDASLLGWGAHWDAYAISGRWNPEESETHQFSRIGRCGQSLRNVQRPTTRVAYLHHQGGTKSQTLHRLTGHVFELYASVYSTLVVRYIPGKRKVLADSPSRGACGNRRMDPQPFGLPRHLSSLGVTHHRPVCRKTKPSASYLRVSDTRHDQVNRRHVPRLERYVGVQVPTTRHTSTDLSEDSTLALRYKLGRPVVAAACWFKLHLLLLVDCPQILPLLPDLLT